MKLPTSRGKGLRGNTKCSLQERMWTLQSYRSQPPSWKLADINHRTEGRWKLESNCKMIQDLRGWTHWIIHFRNSINCTREHATENVSIYVFHVGGLILFAHGENVSEAGLSFHLLCSLYQHAASLLPSLHLCVCVWVCTPVVSHESYKGEWHNLCPQWIYK